MSQTDILTDETGENGKTGSATGVELDDKCLQPCGDPTKESESNIDKPPSVCSSVEPAPAPETGIEPEQEQSKPLQPPPEQPLVEKSTTDNPQPCVKQATVASDHREGHEKKRKDDDKLIMYKALAIKLKKELVKSRDELQKLREDSNKECNSLKAQVTSLEDTLNSERQEKITKISTLEAQIKGLKQQLENSETDLQVLQNDYESYKTRASKIMQQNTQAPSNNTFADDRYKQLKELNDEQAKHIITLESQLSKTLERNRELVDEAHQFQKQLRIIQEDVKLIETLDNKCETLSRENENLKTALKQYRTKLKEPKIEQWQGDQDIPKTALTNDISETQTTITANSSPSLEDRIEETATRLSPSASIKDGSQTNSSSSFDGYVHIKPTTFEIVSRSSVLEDAQIQIDNLTKAYLDSESTNSLLSEQVRALKEEIRRMQRVSDRMELADNLEYLKNVVFKFLSLDSNHTEQKQRLIPVLSTVLKLSPDEAAKLQSLTVPDRTSMASTFFKL